MTIRTKDLFIIKDNNLEANNVICSEDVSANNVSVKENISANSVTVNNSISANSISAPSKNFVIDHPSKPNKKLVHSCLEGPENAVFFRGRSYSSIIQLPDFWEGLIDPDTITVNLTPVEKFQKLYVCDVNPKYILVDGGGAQLNYFFIVYAERKDVPKLQIEV
jgi:hypothetical protein